MRPGCSAGGKARAAKMRAEGVAPWNDARDAVVRDLYPRGVPGAEILARVNALPGPTLTGGAKRISRRALALGLARPPGTPGTGPVWTPARIALFRELWTGASFTWREILDRVNAVGEEKKIGARWQVYRQARRLGIRRPAEALGLYGPGMPFAQGNSLWRNRGKNPPAQRKPPTAPTAPAPPKREPSFAVRAVFTPAEPPPAPPPGVIEHQPEVADAAIARKYARARDLLRQRKEPSVVASVADLPLREVYRLQGELRRSAA